MKKSGRSRIAKTAGIVSLLLVFFLAGCTQTRPDQSIPQTAEPSIDSVELEDTTWRYLYQINGHETTIVNQDGEVIYSGQNVRLFYNSVIGKNSVVVVYGGEKMGSGGFALYDASGQLLLQQESGKVTSVSGQYAVVMAEDADPDTWYSSGDVYDLRNGELVAQEVSSVYVLDESLSVLVGPEAEIIGMLNDDGHVVWTSPGICYEIDIWKDYYVAQIYDLASGNDMQMLDRDFKVVKEFSSEDIRFQGEYALHYETNPATGESVTTVLVEPDGEELYSTDKELFYYDEQCQVVKENDRYTFLVQNIEAVTLGPYDELVPVIPGGQSKATGFYAVSEGTGILWLAPDGTERGCLSVPVSRSLYGTHSGMYGFSSVDGEFFLDDMFCVCFPPSGYNSVRVVQFAQAESFVYKCADMIDTTAGKKWDIYAEDLTPVVLNLTALEWADDSRLVVERGFTRGLLDYEGNWVYQQSVFDGLEDE